MKTILLIVSLAAFFSACSDLGEQKDVFVSLNPPTLTITNSISEPIYYFVIGQNESAYTDWMPSCDETIRISEGKTKRVEYKRQLDAGESTMIVYWWKGKHDGTGRLIPGEMRSIIVRIR